MTEKRDPLDNEVSAEVAVTETGGTVKVRSRLASAVDRLLGNLVDAANLKVEDYTEAKRAVIRGKVELIEAVVRAQVDRVGRDEDFARRVFENHFTDLQRKQENKDSVIEFAIEEMKRLPPPSDEDEASPEELDADWLNFFEPLAEKASSERMRTLFGKILSGEIRRPGTFSLATLRVASEIDQRTAQLFQKYSEVRAGDMIPLTQGEYVFSELLELEVAGLVSFESGHLARNTTTDESGTSVLHFGGGYVLVLTCELPNQRLAMSGAMLTRVGVQLASILPANEIEAWRKMVEAHKPSLKRATLHKAVDATTYINAPSLVLHEATAPNVGPEPTTPHG